MTLRRLDAAVDFALLGPPPDYSRRGGRPAAPGVDLDARLARYLPGGPARHQPLNGVRPAPEATGTGQGTQT